MTKTRKKLIEVALPLQSVNDACAYEKLIKVGKPTNLHLWWARRPLAAARAVIFSQMVDDPSACPEEFPNEEAQEKERQRLFRLIEELVTWENTTNERVLNRARDEIKKSWRRTCADNAGHPRAAELFDPNKLPAFHDPFAGGGALPLEAQRLGLEAWASDLNPVAVLINKAMIEIQPTFAGDSPVNPEARTQRALPGKRWRGTEGLAEDVRYYGQWICDEAEKRIGHYYPKVEITPNMASGRTDLKPYVGRKLTVIAYLWARTVKSPNPAFSHVEVPLISTFMLSSKKGKEVYLEPVIEGEEYRFDIVTGKPKDPTTASRGTKYGGNQSGFACLLSGTPMPFEYLRGEGSSGQLGARMIAIVAEGDRRRVYLPANEEMEILAKNCYPDWAPDTEFFQHALGFRIGGYGMRAWGDLFALRQLVALNAASKLVSEAREQIRHDFFFAMNEAASEVTLEDKSQVEDYTNAVALLLSFCLSRVADWNNSLSRWESKAQVPQQLFGRQVVAMTWDYSEVNPLSTSTGSFAASVRNLQLSLTKSSAGDVPAGHALQADAMTQVLSDSKVVSTDPPYFDNIGYADLSDFFYVWLRRPLKEIYPDLFATLTVPKVEELVATPGRHGGKEEAESFFLEGMTRAINRIAIQAHPGFPVSIYYAFKQSETVRDVGTVSTGWETFLSAVIQAGFSISGTWPMRMENTGRLRSQSSNALASTIVLVCRHCSADAPVVSRREFVGVLRAELPEALTHLRRSNIAPVDLAQAAIGPGMAVFTRFSKVLEADDSPMTVRSALQLINQVVDEAFSEEEQELDPDTRFAVTWYETHKFDEGAYGEAETLATARGVAVAGVAEAGLLKSAAGKVRLLRRDELPDDWDPAADKRLTVWEATQHLIKWLEDQGEREAADLVAKLGATAEQARSLAYRLYTTCERKKWAEEARAYNGLVLAWPELERLAGETKTSVETETQVGLFE